MDCYVNPRNVSIFGSFMQKLETRSGGENLEEKNHNKLKRD